MNYSLIIFSLLFFYFMYIQFNPLDGTQFEKEKRKKKEEKKTRINYLQSDKDTKIKMDAYDKKRQKLASMEDELKIEQDKWFSRDNDKIQKIQTEIETLQKSLEEDQEELDIKTDTDENPESEENPESNSELETLKMELAELNNYYFYSSNPERIKELEEKIKEIEENMGQ